MWLHGQRRPLARLPQPAWFPDCSVEALDGVPLGTLEPYRTALRLRRGLLSDDMDVLWHRADADTIHLARPNGWECVVNFTDRPMTMPPGELLLASTPAAEPGILPPDCAAWLRTAV